MDFATEPVIDAFAPPPRAARASAPQDGAQDGPSFDDHLEAATAEPRPKSPAASDAKSESGSTEQAAEGAVLLGAPVPPQPVVLQIAPALTAPAMAAETPISSAPATPNAAGELAPAVAPTLPAVAAQPAQTNASPAKPAAPAAMKPESAKQAAPPQTPAPTHAAPTNPAPASSAQANAAAPQPAPPPVLAASQTLPAPMQQAPAAATAPMPPSLVATQPRALKTPALETKPAPEFAPVRAAPAKPAKPVAAGAIASEPAPTSAKAPTPAPTLDPAQSLPQQPQLSATSIGSHANTHVQHAATDAGAHRAAPAAAQVAREIIRRFDGGATSFELRLDPPELGRVEVRMEVSRDHRVTAVIAADSPQALTELARHARELEAQLQSAGLQLSDSGLSFDLRQGARGDDAQESEGAANRGGGETAQQQQTQTQTARPIGFERWRGVRVDMMV